MNEYREWLRLKAVSSDAALAEYVSDLVFPFHLREAERFVNQHGSALVLEPRGHAKTTLFIHRVARLVRRDGGARADHRPHERAGRREVLSTTRLPAISVYPDKDKVTRARALAARYEAGKVFHLRGAPGLEAYESEAVAFPNGAFDDRVDAMVYAADLNPTTAEFSFASVRL